MSDERCEGVENKHCVDPVATPEQGYHVSADLVDRAIGLAHEHALAAERVTQRLQ